MYEFNYHRPTTIDDARKLLADNAEASLLAGGMTLLPTMKLRLARPSDIIDLSAIEALAGIKDNGGEIEIIFDRQVRNRGTIGGSVANSDPAADYPAAVLALNATVKTDQREIAADDYFRGMFETALEEGEIITAISFPKPAKAAYAKFANPASRYAIAGVMVAETGDGIRVAVTGAGGCAFRATAFEEALSASFSAEALAGIAVDGADFNSDLHASAEYRAHLVGVMAARAVKALGG